MKINQFIKTYCKALLLNKESEQNIFKYGFKIHFLWYTFLIGLLPLLGHLIIKSILGYNFSTVLSIWFASVRHQFIFLFLEILIYIILNKICRLNLSNKKLSLICIFANSARGIALFLDLVLPIVPFHFIYFFYHFVLIVEGYRINEENKRNLFLYLCFGYLASILIYLCLKSFIVLF